MPSRRTRQLAAVLVAGAVALGVAPVRAAAPSVTATQDRDHARAASETITVTGTFEDGSGNPEPDGTLVHFADRTAPGNGGVVFPGHLVTDVGVHGTGAGDGYWMLDALGEVVAFGAAPWLGDAAHEDVQAPFVAMATDHSVYLLVTAAGEVFPFGLGFHGDTGAILLNRPIMTALLQPDGSGYHVVAEDGGVFAFGAAQFWGSTGNLDVTIVDAALTPSGDGYWMLTDEGDVHAFGDAVDAGGLPVSGPEAAAIVPIAADGYVIVDADGGVHPFGTATPLTGTDGFDELSALPVVAAAPTPDGGGVLAVDPFGRLVAAGTVAAAGSLWTIPTAGGRAAFSFTSLAAGRTTVAAVSADGSASAELGQVWSGVNGYRLVAGDGGVFGFGDSPFQGSTGAIRLNQPIVGMATTPSGRGYWLVAADGGIFAFGDATYHGSTGSIALNQPIVGMASTSTGGGYWLVARDGGIFAFGDAAFHGSTGAMQLNQPIVGMAPTPTGAGYRFVAADGGVFAFGDATFLGSMGGTTLAQPVVGLAAPPFGDGYWLVARDGGIFSFGDAAFHGSTGAVRLNQPIVGMAATATGEGYWFVAADGGVFAYGDAPFLGSVVEPGLARPIVGMVAH
ncbi:MAG: hypothetical protein AB7H43_04600 [Acidimicrobiia bacterium]